jgi:hypothetical protein
VRKSESFKSNQEHTSCAGDTPSGRWIGGDRNELGYNCVYFCRSLDRELWEEYFDMVDEGQLPKAKRKCRLYHGGTLKFAVVLRAGKEFFFDELYLFLNEADARRFFEGGSLDDFEQDYRSREFQIDGRPIGFVERSLYINGKQIVSENPGHPDKPPTATAYRARYF